MKPHAPADVSHAGFTENVIPDLLRWREAGLNAALLTLVEIEGSSPRPLGSQMAVNEHGQWVGNITSGCAEAALATEAVQALAATHAKVERYGRGSRYVDIQLPCGSGIDVYFDPAIPTSVLQDLDRALSAREPAMLSFALDTDGRPSHSIAPITDADMKMGTDIRALNDGQRQVSRPYLPAIRANIAGKGPAVAALAQIAKALAWDVVVSSPERDTLASVARHADTSCEIELPTRFDGSLIDSWTATVLLFHDHEWEPVILAKALEQESFYVGAMGSRKTHALRCEALADMGCSPEQIDRIHAPIGLDIGALSPPEIALAIAGEILAAARK